MLDDNYTLLSIGINEPTAFELAAPATQLLLGRWAPSKRLSKRVEPSLNRLVTNADSWDSMLLQLAKQTTPDQTLPYLGKPILNQLSELGPKREREPMIELSDDTLDMTLATQTIRDVTGATRGPLGIDDDRRVMYELADLALSGSYRALLGRAEEFLAQVPSAFSESARAAVDLLIGSAAAYVLQEDTHNDQAQDTLEEVCYHLMHTASEVAGGALSLLYRSGEIVTDTAKAGLDLVADILSNASSDTLRQYE